MKVFKIILNPTLIKILKFCDDSCVTRNIISESILIILSNFCV